MSKPDKAKSQGGASDKASTKGAPTKEKGSMDKAQSVPSKPGKGK